MGQGTNTTEIVTVREYPCQQERQGHESKHAKRAATDQKMLQKLRLPHNTNAAIWTKPLTALGRSFGSVTSNLVLSHNSFPARPDTPRYRNRPVVTGRGICNSRYHHKRVHGTVFAQQDRRRERALNVGRNGGLAWLVSWQAHGSHQTERPLSGLSCYQNWFTRGKQA